MNDLTCRLVREAVNFVPRNYSIENGDKFAAAVTQIYNLHMTAEYLVPLLQRAYQHWQYHHPERFEYDGDDFWPKYYDDELVFSGICQQILQRRIDRTPNLQLDDWGDLPTQLVNPNTEQVKEHYPVEFVYALEFQKRHSANFDKICKALNKEFRNSTPADNIAKTILLEIKKDPRVGLPLFCFLQQSD